MILLGVWCCYQDGATALLLACDNGHLDVARWLVTVAGSDARSERDKVSSFCHSLRAVSFCFVLIARVAYCFVLCCDQDGCTAFLAACENGHLDVARLLVSDAGSDARSERDDVSCCCRWPTRHCAVWL